MGGLEPHISWLILLFNGRDQATITSEFAWADEEAVVGVKQGYKGMALYKDVRL